MKVADLKEILNIVPVNLTQEEFDDLDVVIPLSENFDGFFRSPCVCASGYAKMALNEKGDETDVFFVIVPCGFFEPESECDGVDPQLN